MERILSDLSGQIRQCQLAGDRLRILFLRDAAI